MQTFIANGRLTKDVELRYTSNNVAVANFSIAIKRDYKNKDGEYDTDFINCVAYKTTAEFLHKYASKGQMIGIVGNIQTRSYDNPDSIKKYVTECIINKVELLSKPENKIEENPVEKVKEEETDPFQDFANNNKEDLDNLEDSLPF